MVQRYREYIQQMRLLPPMQLPTVRGNILDRNNRLLATDKPVFWLCIDYQLTKSLDDNIWKAQIQKKMKQENLSRDQAELSLNAEYQQDFATLLEVIEKCAAIKQTATYDIEVI